MFDAILPTLSLDITDLLDDSKNPSEEQVLFVSLSPLQPSSSAALRQCSICQSVAEWECLQCYEDPDITPGHLKQYCQTCNTQVRLQPFYCFKSPRCPADLYCSESTLLISLTDLFFTQEYPLTAVVSLRNPKCSPWCLQPVHFTGTERDFWLFLEFLQCRQLIIACLEEILMDVFMCL